TEATRSFLFTILPPFTLEEINTCPIKGAQRRRPNTPATLLILVVASPNSQSTKERILPDLALFFANFATFCESLLCQKLNLTTGKNLT
ncbi:MAG: hypothetical protein VW445_07935, partial [Rhodospirillaceae bacterium]